MRAWKRPELFFELAAKLPKLKFRMVGGPDDPRHYQAIRDRAAAVPNLEFAGFVPYADIEREFDGARVFVNTSEAEGFPNTFLQSWARGMPTVSFVDPGCTMSGAAVVQVAHSLDDMAIQVSDLMTNDRRWRELGSTSRAFLVQNHSLDSTAVAYQALIEQLL
jgi:glycosyltransferase involved in cell wall biosynthesis